MILLDISSDGLIGLMAWGVLGGLLIFILPIILFLVGIFTINSNPKRSKKAFVSAIVCLLIGIGICGIPSLIF